MVECSLSFFLSEDDDLHEGFQHLRNSASYSSSRPHTVPSTTSDSNEGPEFVNNMASVSQILRVGDFSYNNDNDGNADDNGDNNHNIEADASTRRPILDFQLLEQFDNQHIAAYISHALGGTHLLLHLNQFVYHPLANKISQFLRTRFLEQLLVYQVWQSFTVEFHRKTGGVQTIAALQFYFFSVFSIFKQKKRIIALLLRPDRMRLILPCISLACIPLYNPQRILLLKRLSPIRFGYL